MKELKREDILVPNAPSKRTAELGKQYSPEFVCTPFKLTLGTFIEGLNRGATELAIGGCNAFCRFGYYWPVQKMILEDLGYEFTFRTVNWEQPWEIVKTLRDDFSVGLNTWQTLRALHITWRKNRLTDLVDKLRYHYRAVEESRGTTDLLSKKAFRRIVDANGMREIKKLGKELPALFKQEIEIRHDFTPLKVAIVGEIYVVLEPALNVDVFRRLNELGVITETPVTLRRFVDVGRKLNPFRKMDFQHADKVIKPYLAHRVGGEAQESLGDTILYKRKGWDGMVHLYPFTCMPEIISRSILPQISREYDMPVLSFVVDEQTGEAGFQTRLEAFIDLLMRKKEEISNNNSNHYNFYKSLEVTM